ncbi:polysaccharide pyruvyl transferase family protein [Marinobacter xiaoshiensis]|uniref:Polysaccharide pyruvyl transferase family protein n=1 Tax=Marinobacter xiaoshiensis TaxID=3073652 RepID=A0ABU2HFX1_9GAMM|nr:polysaccharide pyruvyl transferase family protein [Marinobacter sp. F60267]MDS1309932.1 polysaccharide pyruvyl transferase family protein [Marinobacter sp. F60267]
MAIFYYSDFKTEFNSSNFGDDINPYLIRQLFNSSIIESKDICIVGIGTLLNKKNVDRLSPYTKKIVFSTGVGYGDVPSNFDESWEFVCVRGPKSASQLGLSADKAVCDGAILLSDFYPIIAESDKKIEKIFIPHLKTHWAAGRALRKIVERAGYFYLSPDVPTDFFVEKVSIAKVVVTEAMHGAILADTMRVPWIPVSIHEHLSFKWEDWFSSLGLQYENYRISPPIWNPAKNDLKRVIKLPYQFSKECLVEAKFRLLLHTCQAVLSDEAVLKSKKISLYNSVEYINKKYGDGMAN